MKPQSGISSFFTFRNIIISPWRCKRNTRRHSAEDEVSRRGDRYEAGKVIPVKDIHLGNLTLPWIITWRRRRRWWWPAFFLSFLTCRFLIHILFITFLLLLLDRRPVRKNSGLCHKKGHLACTVLVQQSGLFCLYQRVNLAGEFVLTFFPSSLFYEFRAPTDRHNNATACRRRPGK